MRIFNFDPFMQIDLSDSTLHMIISISYLDVFEVEGHFAVFTVKCPCFTFSFIMSVFLRTKDKVLAGLALYPLKFTATFMLSLNMEDRYFYYCSIHTCRAGVSGVHCFLEHVKDIHWDLWCYITFVH